MFKNSANNMHAKFRPIAFYLPQYHPIPENDKWWGKGFTEWTNVAKAKPLFPGHYQPHIPADLGFYDLRVPETRFAQAELAEKYGIEAFCYWHYWFGGKRLLERPFQEVLRTTEYTFPFCLAWANQSWTGIWHGNPDNILQEQVYPGLKDHKDHFYELLPAFSDDRYVRINGKPIFVIYRATALPDALRVTDYWRELALKEGLAGLHFVANLLHSESSWDYKQHGFDASIIENPNRMFKLIPKTHLQRTALSLTTPKVFQQLKKNLVRLGFGKAGVTRRTTPFIYSYEEAIRYAFSEYELEIDRYPCVVPNWDNTPRSGVLGTVLHQSTPELFGKHLMEALRLVCHKPVEHRFVFIKSWNEWAEGNTLEPDLIFGSGYLEALKIALAKA